MTAPDPASGTTGGLRATLEALDDDVCDALMAAKHGRYDGLPVDAHLERVLHNLRAALATHAEDAAPAGGVEAIAAVLAAHWPFWDGCRCGWKPVSRDPAPELRAHIAAALAAPGDEGHDEDGGGS